MKMAKVLVVTSGKGGVGKTTTAAALGAALAQAGENVVVVDFDVGLRNLDLVMGAERRVVYDMINVIQGDAKLAQALIRDKRIDTLSLLPASQTRDKDALTDAGVAMIIEQLREKFDWIICDSPAGIEKGAMMAMRYADIAIVVTNPEVSSVRDSDRIIGMLNSKTAKAERDERIEKHLLLTRYDAGRAARGEMLKTEDVLEILSIPLLGIVPESVDVLNASNLGSPVTLNSPTSAAGEGVFRRGTAAARRKIRGCHTDTTQKPDGPVIRPEGRSMKFGGMNLGSINLLTLFRRQRTAPVARERLQVLLAHERMAAGNSELLNVLREEILAVIAKHITVDRDKVNVKFDRSANSSTLEIDVEMPAILPMGRSHSAGAAAA